METKKNKTNGYFSDRPNDLISKAILKDISNKNPLKYRFEANNKGKILEFKTSIAPYKRKLQPSTFYQKFNFYTFDTETKDGLHGKELFCYAWAYSKRDKEKNEKGYFRFKTKLKREVRYSDNLEMFFSWFEENTDIKETKIIYVHNLGFDVRFIKHYCLLRKIETKEIISGSNVIAFYIPSFKMKFIDSVQFLQESQDNAEQNWLKDKSLIMDFNPFNKGCKLYYSQKPVQLSNLSSLMLKITTLNSNTDNELQFQTDLMKINCDDLFEKDYELWTKSDKLRVLRHNKNDVGALHRIMHYFGCYMYEITNVNLLNVVSLASLSVKGYQKFLTHTKNENEILNNYIINPFIERRHKHYSISITGKKKYNFVKNAYFGGRTEVFDLNRGKNKKYIDRVSHYPAELRNNYYPVGIPIWVHGHDEIMEQIHQFKKLGIIEAYVMGPTDLYYPILPAKFTNDNISKKEMELGINYYSNGKERLGKVCFTNEMYKGNFTSVELLYAIKHGYYVRCIKALIYPTKRKLFTKFIDKYYTIKKENTGGRKKGGKIVMNSFYGKTGQDIFRKSPVFIYKNTAEEVYDYVREHQLIYPTKEIMVRYSETYQQWYCVCSREQTVLKPFMNSTIAVFCTSYARISLHKLMHLSYQHNIKLLYSDTDSITPDMKNVRIREYKDNFRDEKWLERYESKIIERKNGKIYFNICKELGGWDIEQEFKIVQFLAPKAYFFRDEKGKFGIKLKGCDKRKLKEIREYADRLFENGKSENDCMDFIESELRKEIIMLERYDTYNHSLRCGIALQTKIPKKHFSFEYYKRKVNSDLSTTPYSTVNWCYKIENGKKKMYINY